MERTELYYGQHGEDFLLEKIFKGKSNGYFVEVGCLDGIEFSNTYFFERKGWKGICLEAHHDFIPALRQNRPGAQVVHCAIGEEDRDEVIFYANKAGSLSTVDRSEEERWKKNYADDFSGFEEQKVSMRTLTSVFDEYHPQHIDFVSLDIEGYEVNALKGLDLNKYRPHIFIIEYKDDDHKNLLEEILFPSHYHFLAQIGCNLFYGLDQADKEILLGKHNRIQVKRFDKSGEAYTQEINLSKPPLWERIKGALRRRLGMII